MGKRKKPIKRSPHRARRPPVTVPAAPPEPRKPFRDAFPAAFAFEDRLRELATAHGIDPDPVRRLLVSPFVPLRAWQLLEEVRAEMRQKRNDLQHVVGTPLPDPDNPNGPPMGLPEQIARLEREEAELAAQVRAAHLGRGGKGSLPPPSPRFWLNTPADLCELAPDEPWLNPCRWGWLRDRTADVARYLATTRLVPTERPWGRTGRQRRTPAGASTQQVAVVAADLVQTFYRTYFPRLILTADDVKTAVRRPLPSS